MQPATPIPHGYLDFGRFALDLDGRILIDPSGRDVTLRRREFDLLLTLGRNPGRVMSRATLLNAIAGRDAEAFDRTIDVYVGRIRRKIENDPGQPELIVTVPGVGYRLTAKPKSAQHRGRTDAERHPGEPATREGFSILAAYNKAQAERDAKAISALYAENATIIRRSDALLCGRPSIETMYARYFEHYNPHASKLDHVVAIRNDMMLRAGSWSGTWQGPDGRFNIAGSWTTTDVRDGDTWKIHSETTFIHTRTHIL